MKIVYLNCNLPMSVRWFIGWFVVHKDEKQLLFPREDPIVPYYLLGSEHKCSEERWSLSKLTAVKDRRCKVVSNGCFQLINEFPAAIN